MRDTEFGIVTVVSAYCHREQWGTDCRSYEGRRLRGAPTLDQLAEDQDAAFSRVREKAKEMDARKLSRAVSLYGKSFTRKKFRDMLRNGCFKTSFDVIKQ